MSHHPVFHDLPVLFPIFFLGIWLFAGSMLSLLAGWFSLQQAFPNRAEQPKFQMSWQSGMMGLFVSMSRILTFSVCDSGLRIQVSRIFLPFCRAIFIPWESMTITRREILFLKFAKLYFGKPTIGTLYIRSETADMLARAANESWPEPGPFPLLKRGEINQRIVKEWLLQTCFTAAFFVIAPLLVAPSKARPPIALSILFPAIVFGIFAIIRAILTKS